jgi:hypothetical protein
VNIIFDKSNVKYIDEELYMEISKSYIFKFLFNRLKYAFFTGLIISIIIFIFLGKNITIQYVFGLLLGVLNFILLTLGIDLIVSMNPIRARVAHFLFFALRYLAITIVIVLFILHRNANAFVVVGGLLTMHISIFLTETTKHLFLRKEG